jgi:tripartite-type tricarboxylate transporter receptor subunit TctC
MKFSQWSAALLLAASASGLAGAQTFPDKAIKLVVAYPAGGGVDYVGRMIGRQLGELWKHPVTVDNRTGASGSIGAELVAKAKPDGLTLLLASPAEVLVGPIAGQKTPYDPAKSLIPVVLVGETALGIVAHPSLDVRDVAGLDALAKSQKLSYGTPGAGSTMHFAGEALNHGLGISMVHVPYRGAAPAVNDVLGNQVPLAIVGLPPVVAHTKAGRLKLLAVTTRQRSPVFPDVPTVAEVPGLSDYRFSNWMLLYAPAGTAPAITAKIASDVIRVVQEPAIRQKLLDSGVEAAGLQGAALQQFIAQERQRYEAVARARDVRFAE